jgi:SAM-dependent methyltransferase
MGERATCVSCATVYPKIDGIWRCLAPNRVDVFKQFEHEYRTIRREEGWGGEDPHYYRALPWQDLSGRFPSLWRLRATAYSQLVNRVLPRLEARGPLRGLDLGCGNGWLAYRLTQLGHQIVAIDVQLDPRDGLGAHANYDAPFTSVQGEFDRLPFADHQVDLAVFNGSLHYTSDYEVSLREALRVLRPAGALAIVDTPVYSNPESGIRMVSERSARFREAYGFSSDALDSEHFITRDRLERLARALSVRWELISPFHSVAWTLRPWVARLRGHREPAQFPVLVGTRA